MNVQDIANLEDAAHAVAFAADAAMEFRKAATELPPLALEAIVNISRILDDIASAMDSIVNAVWDYHETATQVKA